MKTAIFPMQINIDDLQLFSGTAVHVSVAHCFCSRFGSPFYHAPAIAKCGRRKAGHGASGFSHQPGPGRAPGASHTPPRQLSWPGSSRGCSSPFLHVWHLLTSVSGRQRAPRVKIHQRDGLQRPAWRSVSSHATQLLTRNAGV